MEIPITHHHPLEGMPTADMSIHTLTKQVQSWGNSVKFTCYEQEAYGKQIDPVWLGGVGERIIAAADLILAKLREGDGR